jgi:transcriptional regulator with XRE-family HTH domain
MLIQERLHLVLKLHNLSPSAFADQLGVQRSNVSHVLSGRNKPSLDFLEKIVLKFPRVNAHWLLTGEMPNTAVTLTEEKSGRLAHERPEAITQGSQLPNTRNSTPSKKSINKIVEFYNDGTFQVYLPE